MQIIESTGKSGPRYALCELLSNLNKDRFKVSLICSTLRDREFHRDIERMRKIGIGVIILQMQREINIISDIKAFLKLCHHIKVGRYDIVHTHNSKAGFLGRLAARLMRVPVVIHTPHCLAFMNEGFSIFKRFFYLYLEKLVGLFTDGLIAVSESQRKDFIKRKLITPQKIFTIENRVDIYKFSNNGIDIQKKKKDLGLDDDSLTLGTVGVLNMSKGHRYLLEALSKIIRDGFDIKLIIAGEGYLQRELERLAQQLGISSRVKFLGYRYDIPEVLSVMDIFVFPSLWEGMPLAVLEAMASGLPVVSTAVHGAIDIIRNNQTGILVERKDVEGLTKAIRYLISHPEEAKRMGREAQKLIIKDYSLDKQIRKTERLYISLTKIT